MQTIKTLLPMASMITVIAWINPSYADEFPVRFLVKASVAAKQLDFEQDSFVVIRATESSLIGSETLPTGDVILVDTKENDDYKADLLTAEFTVSAIYDRAYIAVTVEDTLSDDTVSRDTGRFGYQIIELPSHSSTIAVNESRSSDTDISRYDLSITAGYRITDNINLFGGYKSGETSDDFTKIRQESTFEEAGLYLGASYTFRLESGALSFSTAVADMSMDYQSDRNDPPSEPIRVQEVNYEGDASGLSLSVSWSAPVTESLLYGVALKQHNYQYNADGNMRFNDDNLTEFVSTRGIADPDLTTSINVTDIETNITITTLYASLTYIF